jgi:hypothetical protein
MSSDDSPERQSSGATSPDREDVVPDWLPEDLRDWVTKHRTALDAVFDAFTRDAQWPDPVLLQRQQRAADGHPAIARVLAEMPRQLGWREYAPPRARLSLFGVACCHGSAPLLSAYFQLLQLALQRHSEPAAANRLQRSDVDALAGGPIRARVLSRMVLDDCPFLGGGLSDVDGWDREIDERVVDYEQAASADEFLAVLAERRGLTVAHVDSSVPDRAAAVTAPPRVVSRTQALKTIAAPERGHSRLPRAGGALLFVASLGGLALTIAGTSWVPSLAVIAACVMSFVLPLWRPRMGLGSMVAGIVIAAVLGAVAGLAIRGNTSPRPPVRSQLDAVLKQAADQGMYPAVRRVLRLHAGVPRSHLIVLRDDSERPGGIPHELALPPSDEVRVYDEVGGRLKLQLAFHPQNPDEVQQGPDGDFPGYRLQVLQVVDVNRDGDRELLMSFERRSNATGPLPVPALIWWNRTANEYRLDPVLTEAPELRVAAGLASGALDGYTKPSVVQDQLSESRLVGFPADIIAIRQALRGSVAVTGYPEMSTSGFTGRYEAVGWFLDLDGGRLQLTRCSPQRQHRVVDQATPAQVEDALARAVIRGGRNGDCGQS